MSPPPSSAASADFTDFAEATPISTPAGVHPAKSDGAMAAIGLVVASTVFFAGGDVAAKFLTETVPPLQVAWLRFLFFCAMVVPTALVMGGRLGIVTRRPRLQLLRGLAVTGSTTLFIFGLSHLPVPEATAINFVSPIFITALSIPLLGEKVGVRRWAAAVVGFCGVLIVVQPGGAAFSYASAFPVVSAACWATVVILTRKMSSERPEVTLAWSSTIGLLILSSIMPFVWKDIGLREVGFAAVMGVLSTIGNWLTILAFRKGQASTLAPFSYLQLASAGMFSILVFGVMPGPWTFVGGAVIAASGLYTAHRERLRRKAAA